MISVQIVSPRRALGRSRSPDLHAAGLTFLHDAWTLVPAIDMVVVETADWLLRVSAITYLSVGGSSIRFSEACHVPSIPDMSVACIDGDV